MSFPLMIRETSSRSLIQTRLGLGIPLDHREAVLALLHVERAPPKHLRPSEASR